MSLRDTLQTLMDIEAQGGWHMLTDDALRVLAEVHELPAIRVRAAQEIDLRDTLRREADRG